MEEELRQKTSAYEPEEPQADGSADGGKLPENAGENTEPDFPDDIPDGEAEDDTAASAQVTDGTEGPGASTQTTDGTEGPAASAQSTDGTEGPAASTQATDGMEVSEVPTAAVTVPETAGSTVDRLVGKPAGEADSGETVKTSDGVEAAGEKTGFPTVSEEDLTAEGTLEAILFAMGNSVGLKELAAVIGRTPEETRRILSHMQETRYSGKESGIMLLDLNDSYQLCTKKQYYSDLISIARTPRKPHLTDTVIETLSIIAYRQPVTKAQIEQIRGVSSDHAVNKLLEYDLVKEVGRLNAPGKPLLFATTENFLRYFGLTSTDDLPQLTEGQIENFREEAEAEVDVKVDV